MTALVVLGGSHRDNAIRIPNGALAFRPPAQVLQSLAAAYPPQAGEELWPMARISIIRAGFYAISEAGSPRAGTIGCSGSHGRSPTSTERNA